MPEELPTLWAARMEMGKEGGEGREKSSMPVVVRGEGKVRPSLSSFRVLPAFQRSMSSNQELVPFYLYS